MKVYFLHFFAVQEWASRSLPRKKITSILTKMPPKILDHSIPPVLDNWGQSWWHTERQSHKSLTQYSGRLFSLWNLLSPYSLWSQGDNLDWFEWVVQRKNFSGDLNTRVWYSDGQNLSDRQMVQYLNTSLHLVRYSDHHLNTGHLNRGQVNVL